MKKHGKIKIAAMLACIMIAFGAAVWSVTVVSADSEHAVKSVDNWQAVKFAQVGWADSLPSYFAQKAGAEEDLLGRSGVRLTGLGSGATFEYKNVLDLSNNTKDDVLIQIAVTPEAQNQLDFRQIKMRLTDADDESNYLDIEIHHSQWWYAATFYQVGTAQTSRLGLEWGYYDEEWSVPKGDISGTHTLNGVFTGVAHGYEDDPTTCGGPRAITLRYDDSQRALYCDVPTYIGEDPNKQDNMKMTTYLVLDLDNPTNVGMGNEWGGFKRGRVKLSVTMANFGAATASMVVTHLDGIDMSKEYVSDTIAPHLLTDADETPEILTAVVGSPYKLFGAVADDATDGKIENIVKSVTYPNGEKKVLSGDTFTPEVFGVHTLTYSATDKSGNTAEKSYSLDCVLTAPKMNISLDGELQQTGFVGESIIIPSATVIGGVGTPALDVKVTDQSGTEIKTADGKFTPQFVGTFFVEYSAKDYSDSTANLIKTVNVTRSNAPIGDFPELPLALISGKSVKLPTPRMLDYASSKGHGVKPQTKLYASTVRGEKGAEIDFVYTPKLQDGASESVVFITYEIWCKGFESDKRSKTYEIKVKKMEQLYDLFETKSGNIEPTPDRLHIDFSTSDDNASMRYITPVSVKGFELQFEVPVTANNFVSLFVTLTDSLDAAKKVELGFEGVRGSRKANLFVNGENFQMAGAFDNANVAPFQLIINDDNTLKDSTGSNVARIKTFADGREFTGFDSGRVYVDFEFRGVTGKSVLRLERIADQSINAMFREDKLQPFADLAEPVIVIYGDMESEVARFTRVDLLAANAFDAIDPYVECFVTVTKDGKVIIDRVRAEDADLHFYANEYGAYKIDYEAFDSSGNPAYRQFSVNVYDKTAPTLTILGAVSETAKLNEKLTLPNAVALDSVSQAKLIVLAISPTGKITDITESMSFTPESAGKYTVRYYAFDESYNGTIKDFTVTVK